MPKSLFYKIYFAVIAAFAVLLTVGLFLLSGWLKGYEARQPEKVAEDVIATYIKSGEFCQMRDEGKLKLSTYETKDSVKSFFDSNISGKEITYASVSKRADGTDIGFGISADGQKFMNIYLKKTDDGGYELVSAEFEDSLYKSVKITAPSDAEISVHCITLASELRHDLATPSIPEKYMSGEIIKKQYANIDNLIWGEPAVTASDAFTVTPDDGGIYAVTLSAEDEDAAAIKTFATNAAKTYSCYLQKDSSISDVRKYLATDTDFYKNVSTSYITYVSAHTNYRFDDVQVSELHKFSDNLYSCRIKMTHVIISAGGEEHNDYFDKYVYIYKSGDTMKAIDMQIYGGSENE